MWPIVLAAGQTTAGSRSASQARIFFGPQRGCARRTAISRSPTASAVPFGWACGARERSTSPTGPAARYRSSHLYPVFRLTPYPRHNCEKLSSPVAQDKTKRIRSSIAQVSLHGIGKALLADTETCHPCARSIPLPIYPVRTTRLPKPSAHWEGAIEVLYSRCAGLDVHKDTVVACVRVASEGKVSR